MDDPHPVSEHPGGPPSAAVRRVPRLVWALAGIGLLFGAWQGAMALVRAYVDRQVVSSVGEQLVAFELRDVEGGVWDATDLRGKWLVLNFFRSKCPNCLAEADAVRALVDAVDPAQVEVFGVLMDRVEGYSRETSMRTLDRLQYRHPVLVADATFVDAFHGSGWSHVTPVTYVADPSGRIVAALRGHQTLTDLRAALPDTAFR